MADNQGRWADSHVVVSGRSEVLVAATPASPYPGGSIEEDSQTSFLQDLLNTQTQCQTQQKDSAVVAQVLPCFDPGDDELEEESLRPTPLIGAFSFGLAARPVPKQRDTTINNDGDFISAPRDQPSPGTAVLALSALGANRHHAKAARRSSSKSSSANTGSANHEHGSQKENDNPLIDPTTNHQHAAPPPFPHVSVSHFRPPPSTATTAPAPSPIIKPPPPSNAPVHPSQAGVKSTSATLSKTATNSRRPPVSPSRIASVPSDLPSPQSKSKSKSLPPDSQPQEQVMRGRSEGPTRDRGRQRQRVQTSHSSRADATSTVAGLPSTVYRRPDPPRPSTPPGTSRSPRRDPVTTPTTALRPNLPSPPSPSASPFRGGHSNTGAGRTPYEPRAQHPEPSQDSFAQPTVSQERAQWLQTSEGLNMTVARLTGAVERDSDVEMLESGRNRAGPSTLRQRARTSPRSPNRERIASSPRRPLSPRSPTRRSTLSPARRPRSRSPRKDSPGQSTPRRIRSPRSPRTHDSRSPKAPTTPSALKSPHPHQHRRQRTPPPDESDVDNDDATDVEIAKHPSNVDATVVHMELGEEEVHLDIVEAESQLSQLSIQSRDGSPQPGEGDQLVPAGDEDDEMYGPDRMSSHGPEESRPRPVSLLPPRRSQLPSRRTPATAPNVLVPRTPTNSSNSGGAASSHPVPAPGLPQPRSGASRSVQRSAAGRSTGRQQPSSPVVPDVPSAHSVSDSHPPAASSRPSGQGYDFLATTPPRSETDSYSSPQHQPRPLQPAPLHESQSSNEHSAATGGSRREPAPEPLSLSSIEYVTPDPPDSRTVRQLMRSAAPRPPVARPATPPPPLGAGRDDQITPTQPSDVQDSQHPAAVAMLARFQGVGPSREVPPRGQFPDRRGGRAGPAVDRAPPVAPAPAPLSRAAGIAKRLDFGDIAAPGRPTGTAGFRPTFGAAPLPSDLALAPALLPMAIAAVAPHARPTPVPQPRATRPSRPLVSERPRPERVVPSLSQYRRLPSNDDLVAATPDEGNINRSTTNSSPPSKNTTLSSQEIPLLEESLEVEPSEERHESATKKNKGKQRAVEREEEVVHPPTPGLKSGMKGRGSGKKPSGRSSKENASPVPPKEKHAKPKQTAETRTEPPPPPLAPSPLARSKRTFQELAEEASEPDVEAGYDIMLPTQQAQELAKQALANQQDSSSPVISRRSSPAKRSTVSPSKKPATSEASSPFRPAARKRRRLSAEEDEEEDEPPVEVQHRAPPSSRSPARSHKSARSETTMEVLLPAPKHVNVGRGRGSRAKVLLRRAAAATETRAETPEAQEEDRDLEDAMEMDEPEEQEDEREPSPAPPPKASTSKPKRRTSGSRAPKAAAPKRKAAPRARSRSVPAKKHKAERVIKKQPAHPNRVFAWWKGDSCYWSGTVTASAGGDRFRVMFDDGSAADVTVANLRRGELRVGDIVKDDDLGSGVVRDLSNWDLEGGGTVEVAFGDEDDETVRDVKAEDVKIHKQIISKHWNDRKIAQSSFVFAKSEDEEEEVEPERVATPHSSEEDRRSPTPRPTSAAPPAIRRRTEPPTGIAPRDTRAIFANTGFVITLLNAGENLFDKDQLKRDIEQHGGVVFDQWDKVYSTGKKGPVFRRDDLKFCAKRTIQKVYLITDRPSSTAKYLMALALGIPCMSAKWIADEIQGANLHWSTYLLTAGNSLYLNLDVSQFPDPSWPDNVELVHNVFSSRHIPRPWRDFKILGLYPDTKKVDRTRYAEMMCALGATHVEVSTALKDATLDVAEYDYIIVRDESMAAVRRAIAEDVVGKVRRATWFKQCLMHRTVLPNFC